MTPKKYPLAVVLSGVLVCKVVTLALAVPALAFQANLRYLQHLPVNPSLIERETVLRGVGESTYTANFSPDSKLLACAGITNGVELWNVASKKITRQLYGEGNVNGVAFSPDGRIVGAASDYSITLWNVQTGRVLQHILRTYPVADHSLCFSPDGHTLAVGSGVLAGYPISRAPFQIEFWNVATGRLQKTLGGHWNVISSLQYSPDGKNLVSASYDHTVKFWDARSGRCLWTYTGMMSHITAVFSPDGKTIATTCIDGRVRFLNKRSGQVVRTLGPYANAPYTLNFTPDGRFLIGGGYSSLMRFWVMPTGKLWQRNGIFAGPTSNLEKSCRPLDLTGQMVLHHEPSALVVSPDGTHLAASSFDGELKMWDMNTKLQAAEVSLPYFGK